MEAVGRPAAVGQPDLTGAVSVADGNAELSWNMAARRSGTLPIWPARPGPVAMEEIFVDQVDE
jgi:hypothetical protein